MHLTKFYIYDNGFKEVDKETYEKYEGFKETDTDRQLRVLGINKKEVGERWKES